jgi:membrane protein YdbS with pleckstrin-like domain
MNPTFTIGKQFNPAPQLKKLYYLYTLLVVIFGILPWYTPILVFVPFAITAFITVPIVVILGFVMYWIPKYYKTIEYKLTNDEIVWQRGVWFRKTGIVPYNRITNVDISQGPLSRLLSIASVKIQTAGYSAPSGSTGKAELHLEGIEHYEELQDIIMGYVRGRKPSAVETYESSQDQILQELIKIRQLLEQK